MRNKESIKVQQYFNKKTMKIKKIIINNFRAFKHAEIDFADFNCIIGKNDTGKSTILAALEWFFNPNKELKENDLQTEIDELNDRYKRLFAEFENYKKRNMKERENLRNMLVSDIMLNILPIIDNLEKAISAGTKDTAYEEGANLSE